MATNAPMAQTELVNSMTLWSHTFIAGASAGLVDCTSRVLSPPFIVMTLSEISTRRCAALEQRSRLLSLVEETCSELFVLSADLVDIVQHNNIHYYVIGLNNVHVCVIKGLPHEVCMTSRGTLTLSTLTRFSAVTSRGPQAA